MQKWRKNAKVLSISYMMPCFQIRRRLLCFLADTEIPQKRQSPLLSSDCYAHQIVMAMTVGKEEHNMECLFQKDLLEMMCSCCYICCIFFHFINRINYVSLLFSYILINGISLYYSTQSLLQCHKRKKSSPKQSFVAYDLKLLRTAHIRYQRCTNYSYGKE